jgi:hypothetical protein
MLSWAVILSSQPAGEFRSGQKHSFSCHPSFLSSTNCKMLFQQLSCFDNDPFSWGGCTPLTPHRRRGWSIALQQKHFYPLSLCAVTDLVLHNEGGYTPCPEGIRGGALFWGGTAGYNLGLHPDNTKPTAYGIRKILCSFKLRLLHSFCSSFNPPLPHRARKGSRHNSRDCSSLCGYSSDSRKFS